MAYGGVPMARDDDLTRQLIERAQRSIEWTRETKGIWRVASNNGEPEVSPESRMMGPLPMHPQRPRADLRNQHDDSIQ